MTKKKRQAEDGSRADESPNDDKALQHNAGKLPPAFAVGTDGQIYILANDMPEDKRKGRAIFNGYALTHKEARRAIKECGLLAFNVVVAVFLREEERSGAKQPPQKSKSSRREQP